ncbi:MAG TPA: alpha/beta fold hydrolase [Pyrinomonadaceae bacterium]
MIEVKEITNKHTNKSKSEEILSKPAVIDAKASLSFTEEMKGYITEGETDYDAGYRTGESAETFIKFRLTISIDDVNRFITDAAHEAPAAGVVSCESLWGDSEVEKGIFNLFVDTENPTVKHMLYRLYFSDAEGPLTLSGHKLIRDDPGFDVWEDTTTLFTKIFRGHVSTEEEARAEVYAAGIMHIYMLDFLKQLSTFRVDAPRLSDRAQALSAFGKFFVGTLWDIYISRVPQPSENGNGDKPGLAAQGGKDAVGNGRAVPLFTLEGVKDAEVSTHYFSTEDKLGLSMLRFNRAACDDVVLIIHGLTTSSDMFIMPEHYNLVSYLLDNGFTDVWCLDYRMSNRFPYNLAPHRFNMDDIALFDYPAALAKIREQIGNRRLHVICHCLGAVSFTMSLFGKAVDNITSVIANSAALTPRVPGWSKIKLNVAPFLVEFIVGFPYINTRWSEDPGITRGKVFNKVVSLFHRECDVPACHMLSMMWGTGWPALYSHENLHDVTHHRGGDLYGGTSMHYYRHVRRMYKAGRAVKYAPKEQKYNRLPDDYLQHARDIETPVLFMTGGNNRVFTDSNVHCYNELEQLTPGRHQLHVFPNYGHQDVFMGKNCHLDIFPRMLQFLNEHRF